MHAISGKVVVVSATIYGALVCIIVAPMYLFSFQQSGSLLIRIAGGAYAFTLFPAALISIWSKKVGAVWMILVATLAAVALFTNEIERYRPQDGLMSLVVGLAWWSLISMIPCLMGILLLTAEKRV